MRIWLRNLALVGTALGALGVLALVRCWPVEITWLFLLPAILILGPLIGVGLTLFATQYPKLWGAVSILLAAWAFKEWLHAPATQDRFLVWSHLFWAVLCLFGGVQGLFTKSANGDCMPTVTLQD